MSPYAQHELQYDLDQTFRSTTLLRLEGIDLDRQFSGRILIEQIDEFPSHQLCAEAEIGIFCESVVLPTATPLNRFPPPHSGCPIEIEESAGAVTRGLFDNEMGIEQDFLDASEERITGIDMTPAHLHCSDSLIGEIINHVAQAIRPRSKVGIEDCDQFTFCRFHSVLECARFKTHPV